MLVRKSRCEAGEILNRKAHPRILFGTESRSRRQSVVVRWLIKKKGQLLPSVTAAVVDYAAANDCTRVGDLIKSTRDKFERRILGGDENVYIPVIPPFRNVAFFVKPVGALGD